MESAPERGLLSAVAAASGSNGNSERARHSLNRNQGGKNGEC
jgi:hypothetical protein